MLRSRTPLQARNRKSMPGGMDIPHVRSRTPASHIHDSDFVDALCETVVPLLALRNRPVLRPAGDQVVETASDPLQAYRVAEFTQFLLDEDDDGCEDFAFRQAASGADPQRMATDYLEPAARLIGDYWRMDVCDFMQVTVCMSRIQRLFWRLVEECPPTCETRPGHSILLSPVPGEQHSFGLSVTEDAFRRKGWQVDSCSFDEEEDLYLLARENEYQIIGLSICGEPFAPVLAATILKLRRRSRNSGVSIMAGGSLAASHPEIVRGLGADLVVRDLPQALVLAEAAVAAWDCNRHIASTSG